MIVINGVCKSIDDCEILKGIDLTVQKGSIFGLIGPNGAGKTSLIKTITGIWQPDRGTVRIKGSDAFDTPEIKEAIGYVPDQCHYYDSFKVREMLRFYQLAYKRFDETEFYKLNEVFKIPLSKKISVLSKGTRTKLAIMLNFCIQPEILILDEPTSGLDPIAKKSVLELIVDHVSEKGSTVLISTHNLGDIEQICDSVAVIHQGQIQFTGTVDEMKHNVRKLQVVFKNGMPPGITDRKDILSIKNTGSVYYIVTKQYSCELEDLLISAGASLIEEIGLSLEEIFIYSFGGEGFYAQFTKQSTTL